MIILEIKGKSAEAISAELELLNPGVTERLDRLHEKLQNYHKREIWDYQAALLHYVTRQFNRESARIFEIGTCWGWSAAVMADAAPMAEIVTCTPNPNHVKIARENLKDYPQITVMDTRSVDFLDEYDGYPFDLIFVDGDHRAVHDDMPWWNNLTDGGLFLHHDYTPKGALRECPPVFRELNRFRDYLKRGADVTVIDDNRVGMLGWYRLDTDKNVGAEYMYEIH